MTNKLEDTLSGLYEVIEERRQNKQEGSYTCYLFDKGLDKILKKVGEESAEVIIAAKGDDKGLLVSEICDLTYHLLVLMSAAGLDLAAVGAELESRRQKIGNLKTMHQTDKNS